MWRPSRIWASFRSQRKVSRRERFLLVGHQPDIAVETGVSREVEDAAAQVGEPAPVHAGRRVILVEQRFEVLERAVGFGAGQRRHEMIDDHRAGAALGLRALARIVDDEGIEVRQPGPERERIARAVERHRLARQPFEVAMLAVVDHRMRAEVVAQPEIGGEVAVRRHEVGIVIARGFIEMIAA